jgi:hypothetical protein
MPVTQLDKGNTFRALHQGTRAFVIANAWDAGGARSGGPRFFGDRHLQLRDCRRIRHARRQDYPRPGARARARDR